MSRTAEYKWLLRDLPVYGPASSPKTEQEIQIMSHLPLRFPIRERPCFSLPADLPCRLIPVSPIKQPVSSYQVITQLLSRSVCVCEREREIEREKREDGQNEEGETVTILIADSCEILADCDLHGSQNSWEVQSRKVTFPTRFHIQFVCTHRSNCWSLILTQNNIVQGRG